MKLLYCHFISHLYYLALVEVFTYGESIWHTSENVLVLQKNVLSAIAGVPPRTHTDSLFVQFDIFPVKRLYVCTIGIVMYKYDDRMLPEIFRDMFTSVNDIHDHKTKQAKSKKSAGVIQTYF